VAAIQLRHRDRRRGDLRINRSDLQSYADSVAEVCRLGAAAACYTVDAVAWHLAAALFTLGCAVIGLGVLAAVPRWRRRAHGLQAALAVLALLTGAWPGRWHLFGPR